MAPGAAWTDSRKLDLLRTHLLTLGKHQINAEAVSQNWLGEAPTPTPRAIKDTFNAMMRAGKDQASLKSFGYVDKTTTAIIKKDVEIKKSEEDTKIIIAPTDGLITPASTPLQNNHTGPKNKIGKISAPKYVPGRKRKRTQRRSLSDEEDGGDSDGVVTSEDSEVPTPTKKRQLPKRESSVKSRAQKLISSENMADDGGEEGDVDGVRIYSEDDDDDEYNPMSV